MVVNGFDVHGRPIVWLRPSRENTKPSPRQVRHLIWQLERAIDIMPEGVNKLALVVDYKGANNNNNPPLSTAKEVINILQNHYCERLGRAVVINVPWYLNSFFSLLKPFLDPATKDKIQFNPEMTNLVNTEQLDAEFGGEHAYFYDHRVYMPALCSYCGIKEDGTRDLKPMKDQPEARPDELQRRLTSQVDESDRIAAEAREDIAPQEANRPAVGSVADEPIPKGVPTADQAGNRDAIPPIAAGAAVLAEGPAVAAAAHKEPTEGGQTEVKRVLQAQAGDGQNTAATAETSFAEPPSTAPVEAQAAPTETVPAARPTPSPAVEEVVETPVSSTSATPNPVRPSEKATTPAPDQPVQREGRSSTQERSIQTPTPSQPKKQPAAQPKGFKKLLAMCGCLPNGADKAFADSNGPSQPASIEKKIEPAIVITTPTHSRTGDNNDSDRNGSALPSEPGRDRVKIAPEAAASKPATNAPLATNATFGPEAYQTALEGPGEGDDYFTQGDLRKAHPKPHDESVKDAAQTVAQPEKILQRLHTGGSEDLVMAFEVKEPPQQAVEGETAAADEAASEETTAANAEQKEVQL